LPPAEKNVRDDKQASQTPAQPVQPGAGAARSQPVQPQTQPQRTPAQNHALQNLAERKSAAAIFAQAPQVHTTHGHGEKLPCPSTGWQYVDPKNNVRGPFTLLEMQQWNGMGYFKSDLPMRCDVGDRFTPFAELFPHPMIPFQSYPKRQTR